MRTASSAPNRSPLPITGMFNTLFNSPILDQFAFPSNIWARLLGCRVTASHPSSWAILPTSRKVSSPQTQPVRILTVSGSLVALLTLLMMRPTLSGSFMSALPAPVPTTFFTGHPMFMSIRSPYSSTSFAASASISGSSPKSCIPMGRSSGVVLSRSKLLRPSLVSPLTLTISVKVSEAPASRAMSRIGRLVIPAMGARKRRFFSSRGPMATVFRICR